MALERFVDRLRGEAPAALDRLPGAERAVVVDQLVRSAVDAAAARCLGYRGFAKLVRGGSAPEQALMKAFCSEAQQRLTLTAAEMLTDHTIDLAGEAGHADMTWGGEASWIERYFVTFGGTISAGSSEIQRNIIAEKVLGLPRS
jgi:alkylation response protein AidB-like acyl-CoA dehydrogenase